MNLKKFLDPREEPILHGIIALAVLMYGAKMGIPAELLSQLEPLLQGYTGTMAAMVLRAQVNSPATVKRLGAK